MLATLSCQLVLGLDEPVTAAADAGPSEAGAADAGGDADKCVHATVPAAPDGGAAGGNISRWFAITAIELPAQAPKLRGLDLDESCTCDPASGDTTKSSCIGKDASRCDLANGVDDALSGLLQTVLIPGSGGDPAKVASEAVRSGARTLLIYISGWNGLPNDADVSVGFVSSRGLFEAEGCVDAGSPDRDAAAFNLTDAQSPNGARYSPRNDGCDRWSPVISLDGTFPNLILNGGTVHGYVVDRQLVAPFDEVAMVLLGRKTSLRDGYLVATLGVLTGDSPVAALSGTLAGRIEINELVAAVGASQVGKGDDTGNYQAVCEAIPGLWSQSILPTLCDARDVMASKAFDGQDKSCDGVSVALGFRAVAALPSRITFNPPDVEKACTPSACP